jgi:hypothetical protein
MAAVEQDVTSTANSVYETAAFKELTRGVQLAVKVIDALEAESIVFTGTPFKRRLGLVQDRAHKLFGSTVGGTTLKKAVSFRKKHPLRN